MSTDEHAALERNPAYIKKQEDNVAKFNAMQDEFTTASRKTCRCAFVPVVQPCHSPLSPFGRGAAV
jgi:hypothetical protein